MPSGFWNHSARFAAALVATAVALALRMLTEGMIDRGLVYIFFWPAVAIVAIYGGIIPGVVCTLASALASVFFILIPAGGFGAERSQTIAGLTAFLGMSALLVALAEAKRHDRRRAADALAQAETHRIRLEAEMAERLRTEELVHLRNEELQTSNEELEMAHEELRVQNEELSLARLAVDQERRRYRDLFEFAPDGYLVIDSRGAVVEFNHAAARLLAAATADLPGRRLLEFVAPDSREALAGVLAAIARGDARTELDVTLQPAAGSAVPAALTAAPLRDAAGAISGGRLLIRDISDRKRTELRLQAERRRTENILNSISDAFYALDHEWRFSYVNPRAEQYFGRPAGTLLGRVIWEEFPAKRDSIFYREYARAVAENTRIQFEALSPGTNRWVAVHAYPFEEGLSIFLHDVTDRRNAQFALQRANAELARSNADLERFAYVISHDLREPVRNVTMFASFLQKRCESRLDAEGLEFIGFISDAATRMTAMIQDLLNLAKVASQPLKNVALPLSKALDNALFNLHTAVSEAGAQVSRDETLPTIAADPGLLTQLLQNLLSNAIKFRGPQECRIHVGARCVDGEWTVHVRDNGIGLDPRHAASIFEIFRRLHGRDEYAGTGIGLALCKKIVERHGGRIWVDSRPGEGATFFFTLPARPD